MQSNLKGLNPIGGFHLGLRLGRGRATLSGLDVGNDTEEGPSWSANTYMTYWLDPNLALEIELMLTGKSSTQAITGYQPDNSMPGGGYSYTGDITWNLTSLEIPVLFRWATSERARTPDGSPIVGMFEPFFEFGPGVSITLADKHSNDLILATQRTPEIPPMIDYLNFGKVIFTLNVGVGANLRAGPGFVNTQVRFSAGFSGHGNNPDNAQMMTIWMLVGYGWSFA
jgi:hypothetical protein